MQNSYQTLMVALIGMLTVLAACVENKADAGPTPIEIMLAQDSASRAASGDSSNKHIAFDYENLNRVVWQKPDVLINRLGELEGKTVVEIGSGTGFFTRRLAKLAGKVIALDIDPRMLIILDSLNMQTLDEVYYARIDPRLVPADNPNLGEKEGQAALVVNTFMYIQDRVEYLKRLSKGLQPGSPILIVDFKAKSTPVGPPMASRLPLRDVEVALQEAGFENIITDDSTLDYQYIVMGQVPIAKE